MSFFYMCKLSETWDTFSSSLWAFQTWDEVFGRRPAHVGANISSQQMMCFNSLFLFERGKLRAQGWRCSSLWLDDKIMSLITHLSDAVLLLGAWALSVIHLLQNIVPNMPSVSIFMSVPIITTNSWAHYERERFFGLSSLFKKIMKIKLLAWLFSPCDSGVSICEVWFFSLLLCFSSSQMACRPGFLPTWSEHREETVHSVSADCPFMSYNLGV